MNDILPKTAKLNMDGMARMADAARHTAELAMKRPTPALFTEAMELATASAKRASTMQANWLNAWANWATYANSLDGADTVPKYFERLGNIGLRAQAQMVAQASDLAEFGENVSVSYAYWVSQQLERD